MDCQKNRPQVEGPADGLEYVHFFFPLKILAKKLEFIVFMNFHEDIFLTVGKNILFFPFDCNMLGRVHSTDGCQPSESACLCSPGRCPSTLGSHRGQTTGMVDMMETTRCHGLEW